MAAAGGRSGKLTVGAVLCILSGASVILFTIIGAATGGWTRYMSETGASTTMLAVSLTLAIVTAVIAIAGGYRALRRKAFWWAMAGAVCTVWSAVSLMGLLGTALGLAAIILIWLSKKEFA